MEEKDDQKNNQQYYVTEKKEPLHIKECFGGVYKELRLLTLKFSNTDKLDKASIIKEFKLCVLDVDSILAYMSSIQKDEIDIEEYYQSICKILFLEQPEIKFEEINMREVRRAVNYFFANLNAS
jgi:hypothetical protein